MNIYVASSWRNVWQPGVVKLLRACGHAVYDAREMRPAAGEFDWSAIDAAWPAWSPQGYRTALGHPLAERAFASDFSALDACHACVLVLPCGRSSYLEFGFAVGRHKRTVMLFPQGVEAPGGHELGPLEPELAAKMAGRILVDADELKRWAERSGGPSEPRGQPGTGAGGTSVARPKAKGSLRDGLA
jgi:hypothetical protein